MENPRIYSEFDKVQKNRISSIIEEFSEDLINIRGKCMDIGCGPGDITKDFLLPSLGSNAQIIGKRIINCRNIITKIDVIIIYFFQRLHFVKVRIFRRP